MRDLFKVTQATGSDRKERVRRLDCLQPPDRLCQALPSFPSPEGMPEAQGSALAIGRDSWILESYVTASTVPPPTLRKSTWLLTVYFTASDHHLRQLPFIFRHPLSFHLGQGRGNFTLCWPHTSLNQLRNSQARVLQLEWPGAYVTRWRWQQIRWNWLKGVVWGHVTRWFPGSPVILEFSIMFLLRQQCHGEKHSFQYQRVWAQVSVLPPTS